MPRRPSSHVDDPVAVGRRLREARTAAGLTQRNLSFEGCTPAYVSRIEAGARVPSLQILREFGKRLDVSADYLATGVPGSDHLGSDLLDAEIALRLGDEAHAEELYEAARVEADSPRALAQVQLGLGRLAAGRGDLSEAVALLEKAFDSGELASGDASAAAEALGRLYAKQRRFDEASALFERFYDEAQQRDDAFDRVRFALLLANAYVEHGDDDRAHATLGEVLDAARQAADPMLRARLYWSQSRVQLEQSEPARAAEYAQLALATLKATEQTLAATEALLKLASIENRRGNAQAALELYELAVEQAAPSSKHTAEALAAMAEIYEERGEAELALELLKRALAARTGTPA